MININQVCTSKVSFSLANFNLASSVVHIVQHLLIAHCTTIYTLPTLPPFHRAHFTTPSYYTLYNFVRPPYPPCLDGLVQRLHHLALIGLISPHIGQQAPTDLNPPPSIFLLRPSSFFLSLHSNGLKANDSN